MPKSFHNKFFQRVSFATISLLAGTSVGCSQSFLGYLGIEEVSQTHSSGKAVTPASTVVEQTASIPERTLPNVYQQAIDRASSAFTLGRSAQSQDDWKLVASRWQQAIDLMASVPASHAQHIQAQQKVSEYRNNLAYAQQQANRSTVDPGASGTVVVRTSTNRSGSHASQPIVPLHPAPSVATTARSPSVPTVEASTEVFTSASSNIFHAPIIRREGNTPVIRVTFNGNQTFDMIVDTGASGTLITQQMAQTMGVAPVAAAMVDTASQRGVTVPLGYVNSIEVNGAVATNVLVAIAGPQLGTGLLGHDFFGNYDVTIRENEVEFRERG